MAFMQTMFEAYEKNQKKSSKSKKRKKRDYDSSDSSDSEQGTGYGDTRFSVDKRLKLDKPLGTINLSIEPHPIKFVDTAPSETTRANEIAIETAKTGKVTAVVTVMSIFSKKRYKSRSTNIGDEKPSRLKAESANFLEENSHGLRNLSQKQEMARY